MPSALAETKQGRREKGTEWLLSEMRVWDYLFLLDQSMEYCTMEPIMLVDSLKAGATPASIDMQAEESVGLSSEAESVMYRIRLL